MIGLQAVILWIFNLYSSIPSSIGYPIRMPLKFKQIATQCTSLCNLIIQHLLLKLECDWQLWLADTFTLLHCQLLPIWCIAKLSPRQKQKHLNFQFKLCVKEWANSEANPTATQQGQKVCKWYVQSWRQWQTNREREIVWEKEEWRNESLVDSQSKQTSDSSEERRQQRFWFTAFAQTALLLKPPSHTLNYNEVATSAAFA